MYNRKTYNRTCISIYGKIGKIDQSTKQSKPCNQIYWQKILNCINLQLAIKITLFGHALPRNGHLGRLWDQSAYKTSDYREKKLFTQTDGQTDRRRV